MQTLESINCSDVSIKVPWGHLSGRWYGNKMQHEERPILALHGWQDSCGSFAKLAPLIAPHRSILCLDLPGHGRSSHLPAGILYHKLEFVRVILRLMQAYSWKTVSLMGHSMGGSVCFHFAAFYPELVDMVISLDILKNTYWNPNIYISILRYFTEKALSDNERLLAESKSEPPSYSFEECEQLLFKASAESVALENCKYILERNVEKSKLYPNKYYFSRDGRVKLLMEMNPDGDQALEMAKRICGKVMPYMVIRGGRSQNASAAATELDEFMVQHNRNFECHIYPMGTHHLHLNNPEIVAKLIIDFMHKHERTNANSNKSKL